MRTPTELGARAEAMLAELAAFTDDDSNLTRLYLSSAHRAAAGRVAEWMHGAGLDVGSDALGTVRGRLKPTAPGRAGNRRVLIGSHIDTVVNAGRYDGMLGVVAGILAAEEMRPFQDRDAIVAAFEHVLRAAGRAAKLALIRAHPDLATKAQSIADDSRREQAGAGLDALSPEEFDRFEALNKSYRERFGFPFILAIRGATKADILVSFEERLGNSPETEFERALDEITRIFRFRIEDRVAS